MKNDVKRLSWGVFVINFDKFRQKIARFALPILTFLRHTTSGDSARAVLWATLGQKGGFWGVENRKSLFASATYVQSGRLYSLENIGGRDYKMLKVFDLIEAVADTPTAVLATGESGTGKGMIARAMHQRSNRRDLQAQAGTRELAGRATCTIRGAGARTFGTRKTELNSRKLLQLIPKAA